MSHGEPFLLRSFAGIPDKLSRPSSKSWPARKSIVPCMVDGNKEDLHKRRAKIQRLKVSLKLQDYNPKRDFVGWGGEDFRRLAGMPGFTHYSALTRVDPEAQAITAVDFDGDGKPDLCLVGAGRVALLQNGGESLNEVSLPGGTGCRAAVWADYNGDGKPDLLLATPPARSCTPTSARTASATTAICCRAKRRLQPDRRRLDRPRRRRPARHPPRQRLPRPAPLSQQRPDRHRRRAAEAGQVALHRPVRQRRPARASPRAYPPEKEIDLTKKYPGKGNGELASWHEGKFDRRRRSTTSPSSSRRTTPMPSSTCTARSNAPAPWTCRSRWAATTR